MSKSDAGKGDDPRQVNPERFARNHDAINWCKHEWRFLCGKLNTVKCSRCNTLRDVRIVRAHCKHDWLTDMHTGRKYCTRCGQDKEEARR